MEILAPAGNMEALIAAVRCGANAVYLGMTQLNARRNAGNFNAQELNKAVAYCHCRDVKVYLTANTLVSDAEMDMAHSTVDTAMEAGVDGFIVQDIGMAKMIRQCFPQAKLHASTQCSATTPDGFKALEKMGFVRAVIPREMSEDEIAEIRACTNMELEAFVHGALCMCVSGQCYMSAMLGGRSGNRGLCAQPCRLQFSADDRPACDLSLKDLSLIRHIQKMEKLGICSLKIEGRMKRPEYVAAAVTACKEAINKNYSPDTENILRSVFSRSGFTDGYFTGKREDMFGTRQKEDVMAAGNVLKELSHLYDNENPLVPISLSFFCHSNQPSRLTVTKGERTVTVTGPVPQAAINAPMTAESLTARLSKLGGTQFYAHKVDTDIEEGLILPAGVINGMRRDAVEKLNIITPREYDALPLPDTDKVSHKKTYYTARFLYPDRIPHEHPFKRVFIPIWSEDKYFEDNKIGVEIPRGLFGCEEKLKKQLSHLRDIGVTMALCPNIGAYKTAQDMGFAVYGDFGMNVFNSMGAQQVNSPILSYELTLEQANAINAYDTGIIVYGSLPLMLTRNCPVKNRIGCQQCNKNGSLTDRKGYKLPVKCSSYPCVEILNPLPLYLGDRMREVKTDFAHLYFTDESRQRVEQIIDMFNNGSPPDTKFTRGLYYRGVK